MGLFDRFRNLRASRRKDSTSSRDVDQTGSGSAVVSDGDQKAVIGNGGFSNKGSGVSADDNLPDQASSTGNKQPPIATERQKMWREHSQNRRANIRHNLVEVNNQEPTDDDLLYPANKAKVWKEPGRKDFFQLAPMSKPIVDGGNSAQDLKNTRVANHRRSQAARRSSTVNRLSGLTIDPDNPPVNYRNWSPEDVQVTSNELRENGTDPTRFFKGNIDSSAIPDGKKRQEVFAAAEIDKRTAEQGVDSDSDDQPVAPFQMDYAGQSWRHASRDFALSKDEIARCPGDPLRFVLLHYVRRSLHHLLQSHYCGSEEVPAEMGIPHCVYCQRRSGISEHDPAIA